MGDGRRGGAGGMGGTKVSWGRRSQRELSLQACAMAAVGREKNDCPFCPYRLLIFMIHGRLMRYQSVPLVLLLGVGSCMFNK